MFHFEMHTDKTQRAFCALNYPFDMSSSRIHCAWIVKWEKSLDNLKEESSLRQKMTLLTKASEEIRYLMKQVDLSSTLPIAVASTTCLE